MPRRVRAGFILGAGLGFLGLAHAGHEFPFYPSFFPQEITVEVLDAQTAAQRLAAGTLHAYAGERPGDAGRPREDRRDHLTALDGYVVATLDRGADPAARCAKARALKGALGDGYTWHPYAVTPFHADASAPRGPRRDGAQRCRAAGAPATPRPGRSGWPPAARTGLRGRSGRRRAGGRRGLRARGASGRAVQRLAGPTVAPARLVPRLSAARAVGDRARRARPHRRRGSTSHARRLPEPSGAHRARAWSGGGAAERLRAPLSPATPCGANATARTTPAGRGERRFRRARRAGVGDLPAHRQAPGLSVERLAQRRDPVGAFRGVEPGGRRFRRPVRAARVVGGRGPRAPPVAPWQRVDRQPGHSRGREARAVRRCAGKRRAPQPGAGEWWPWIVKTAALRIVYRVRNSAFHDGTTMTPADALYPYAFAAAWGAGAAADPGVAAATQVARERLRGVRCGRVDTETLAFGEDKLKYDVPVIEVYLDHRGDDPSEAERSRRRGRRSRGTCSPCSRRVRAPRPVRVFRDGRSARQPPGARPGAECGARQAARGGCPRARGARRTRRPRWPAR